MMAEVADNYHASLLARFAPKKKGAAAVQPEEKLSAKEQAIRAKKAAREAAKNFCPGRVLLLQRGRLLSLALLWS